MEQHILATAEEIVHIFNDRLVKTITDEKTKLIDDFKAQIKSDVVQKLNGSTKSIFDDKRITLQHMMDDIRKYFVSFKTWSGNESKARMFADMFLDNWMKKTKDFRPNEYIINYKYQIGTYSNNSSFIDVYLLYLTNYGTFSMIPHQKVSLDFRSGTYSIDSQCYNATVREVSHIGKYILPDEVLTTITAYIDAVLPGQGATKNVYGRIGDYDLDQSLLNIIGNTGRIIEAIQNEYFAKPLTGYYAQQLIDENKKLRNENEEIKQSVENIKQERALVQQMRYELDADMRKYANIKDMEEKWSQLREYKLKLDLLSDSLKTQKEEFEKDKQRFEEEKGNLQKRLSGHGFEEIILNNDFSSFINDNHKINPVGENDDLSIDQKHEGVDV